MEKEVQHIQNAQEKDIMYNNLVDRRRKQLKDVAFEISMMIPTNAPSPEGKDLDVFSMKLSEADKIDSVSLPWLQKDGEDIYNDPYLDYENVFLEDEKRNIFEGEDVFNASKTIIT